MRHTRIFYKMTKCGFLFFCSILSLQAQESKKYDYFHPEYDDPAKKTVVTGRYNDNRIFVYDVALEKGLSIPLTKHESSNGSATTLYGSCFLTDGFGFRSGISYITELDACKTYWKIPFLFAFRIGPVTFSEDNTLAHETFKDCLLHLLLNVFPKRLEFNSGFSLGYMNPYHSRYGPDESHPSPFETTVLDRRFALSTDANIRMIYQIGPFGLYINMGISYLWTRNYIHTIHKFHRDEFRPAWFANLGIGASCRF